MTACINTFVLTSDHVSCFEKVFTILLPSMVEKRLASGKITIYKLMDYELTVFLASLAMSSIEKKMFVVFTTSDVLIQALSREYTSITFVKVDDVTDVHPCVVRPITIPFLDSFPSCISENLYLGSKVHAMSFEILESIGADLVINCSRDIPNYFETLDTDRIIDYIRVPINDSTTEDIGKYFEATSKRIQQALESGRTVFVHCKAGVSRSASIVIAHLMKNEKLPFEKAYAKVLAARPCVSPNMAFSATLVEYGRKLE